LSFSYIWMGLAERKGQLLLSSPLICFTLFRAPLLPRPPTKMNLRWTLSSSPGQHTAICYTRGKLESSRPDSCLHWQELFMLWCAITLTDPTAAIFITFSFPMPQLLLLLIITTSWMYHRAKLMQQTNKQTMQLKFPFSNIYKL